MTDQLTLVLSEIQRRGGIGRGDITTAIAHAEQYVEAGGDPRAVIDLGSGGGLPGLVVAMRFGDAEVTLIERRAKRADLLRFGVLSLGLGDRVTVAECDVATFTSRLARSPDAARLVDLVTARSFGRPEEVAGAAAPLLRPGGFLVVSEPPVAVPHRSRWDHRLLAATGLIDDGRHGGVRRLIKLSDVPLCST